MYSARNLNRKENVHIPIRIQAIGVIFKLRFIIDEPTKIQSFKPQNEEVIQTPKIKKMARNSGSLYFKFLLIL